MRACPVPFRSDSWLLEFRVGAQADGFTARFDGGHDD